MRKIAAILLLGIFVFNLFGYRIFVSYMVKASDKSLQATLDKEAYNEAELISIKKAVNLPYYNNDPEFSPAYGETELNGLLYKYVKSRVYNDSLEMLCIPNTTKQNLLTAKDNFTQVVFDMQNSQDKKSPASEKQHSLLKFFTEYESNTGWNFNTSITPVVTLQNHAYYNNNCGLLHKASAEQPPDISAVFPAS